MGVGGLPMQKYTKKMEKAKIITFSF